MTPALRLLCSVGMIYILYAGLTKLLDLPSFADDLRTWSRIPTVAVESAILLVPIAEYTLPLMWLLSIRRQSAAAGIIILLALITAAYVVQASGSAPVRCGCRTPFLSEDSHGPGIATVVLRNSLLMLTIIAGLTPGLLRFRRSSGRAGPRLPRPNPAGPAGAGFTLTETILVIALIAVLVAMIAPHLGATRDSARRAATLSNLKQHSAIVAVYASDWKDAAPYLVSPDAPINVLRCPTYGIASATLYFDSNTAWNIPLASVYYNSHPRSGVFRSPMRGPKASAPSLATEYAYSCAFLASPEYFNLSTRQRPPIGFRAVRSAEILFPSQKSTHADWRGSSYGGLSSPSSAPVGFADGHAEMIRQLHPTDPGDGVLAVNLFGGHHVGRVSFPFLHTFDGVRGRDIE